MAMRWKKFNVKLEDRWTEFGSKEEKEFFNRDKMFAGLDPDMEVLTAGLDPDMEVLDAGQVPDRNIAKVILVEVMVCSISMSGRRAWKVKWRR